MLILPSLIKAKLNLKFLMVTLLLGSSLSFHIANAKESSVNSSVQSKNPDLKLMIKDTVLTVNNFFHYFSSKIINLVFIFALKGASFLSTP